MPLAAQPILSPPAPNSAIKTPFVKSEARAVVAELAIKLEEEFVIPDVGKAYASMLRSKLAAGAYDKFSSAEIFAEP